MRRRLLRLGIPAHEVLERIENAGLKDDVFADANPLPRFQDAWATWANLILPAPARDVAEPQLDHRNRNH
jgi:hypothetical protein